MKYSDKLKNPKWQKMRLKVLERDYWSCRICFNEEETLHVHHKYYEKGKEPWDYPLNSLVTLCRTCHEEETINLKEEEEKLLREIKKRFSSNRMSSLTIAFGCMVHPYAEDLMSYALEYTLTNEKACNAMLSYYLSYLTTNNKKSLADALLKDTEDSYNVYYAE